ncbi:MAG: class I SAM-dependent methyltransferase, partial [Anaerolineales bacterium]|nr:class I SAM-dependent methyltransferase [Anaerolineales bacterium]
SDEPISCEAAMSDSCRVYELEGVQRVTGETIRPGGLALTQRALALANLPAGARALDVGCGAGATVAYLAESGLRAVGLDPSAKLLRQRDNLSPQLAFSQGRGENLPFAAGQFDALSAECCLSLMDDVAGALAEFARVLRPGGTLLLSDMLAGNPAGLTAARRLPLSCCVTRAFSRSQIASLLADAGFAITFWEDNSEALKQLTVQIIWEYGSLANFWRCSGEDGAEVGTAVAALKPGYFLLLGRKRDTKLHGGDTEHAGTAIRNTSSA